MIRQHPNIIYQQELSVIKSKSNKRLISQNVLNPLVRWPDLSKRNFYKTRENRTNRSRKYVRYFRYETTPCKGASPKECLDLSRSGKPSLQPKTKQY